MPYRRLTKHADSLMHIYYGCAVCDCKGRNLCLSFDQLNTGIVSLDVAHFAKGRKEGSAISFAIDEKSIISVNGINYTLFDPRSQRRDAMLSCMSTAYCGKSCGLSYRDYVATVMQVHQDKDICHVYAAIFAAIFNYYNRYQKELRSDWHAILVYALDKEFAKYLLRLQTSLIFKMRVSKPSDAQGVLQQSYKMIKSISAFLGDIEIHDNSNPGILLPSLFSRSNKRTSLYEVLTSCFVSNPSLKYGIGESILKIMPVPKDSMRVFKNNQSFLADLLNYLSRVDKFIQDESGGIAHSRSEWEDIETCINSLLTIPPQMTISA